MKPIKEMSDTEIIDLMRSDSPLSKARRIFSSSVGKQEQAMQQRSKPTTVEMRRMEFEAVLEIIGCFVYEEVCVFENKSSVEVVTTTVRKEN